jgi:hypothetical protein
MLRIVMPIGEIGARLRNLFPADIGSGMVSSTTAAVSADSSHCFGVIPMPIWR